MRIVLQRVAQASIVIDGAPGGRIEHGFVALVGFCPGDGAAEIALLTRKLAALRVFDDEAGNLNLALGDVGGSLLIVPNFTLYADCRKGRRPAFVRAERPERATQLFDHFVAEMRATGVPVETGRFGTNMQVSLVNDGPVTILLDSEELGPKPAAQG